MEVDHSLFFQIKHNRHSFSFPILKESMCALFIQNKISNGINLFTLEHENHIFFILRHYINYCPMRHIVRLSHFAFFAFVIALEDSYGEYFAFLSIVETELVFEDVKFLVAF